VIRWSRAEGWPVSYFKITCTDPPRSVRYGASRRGERLTHGHAESNASAIRPVLEEVWSRGSRLTQVDDVPVGGLQDPPVLQGDTPGPLAGQ
jgi:hypothetical protein